MKTVPLSNGLAALVDDEDYEHVVAAGPWHATKPRGGRVYAQRSVRRPDGRRTTQKLHMYLTGWPETDHWDRNGLNNRRTNLRLATRGQNNANTRLRSDSTSGFKGVAWHKRSRYWYARIRVGGQTRFLGCFPTPEDAARAYDQAALEAYGSFARLNFPLEIT